MSFIPNIFLGGEVSSGKSSLLNALASGFISCVSLDVGTFTKSTYQFRETSTDIDFSSVTTSLEQTYEDNQKLRDQPIIPPSQTYIIPSRHSFKNMNIIDYPGLNDSQDKDNKFMKMLEENIHEAHAIFFITSADKAFTNTSELENYNKIKQCIDNEFKKNYHYISLIIIVNKYDDTKDRDIYRIYKRMSTKVTEPIFRLSSHKLLTQTIIDRQGYMYVPKFLRTEAIKILKNSDISMDQLHKNFSKKVTNWTIPHSSLNFVDTTNTDPEDKKDDDEASTDSPSYNITGDWDNLITYLNNFQQNYITQQTDKLKDIIFNKCATIHNMHKLSKTIDYNLLAQEVFSIEKVLTELYKLYTITSFVESIKEIDDTLSIISTTIDHILDYSFTTNKTSTNRFINIEMLYNISPSPIYKRNILQSIIKHVHQQQISYTTILSVLNKTDMTLLCSLPSGKELILNVLSEHDTYTSKIPFSANNQENYYRNGQFIKTHFCTSTEPVKTTSWFISLLLNSATTPPELKYTVIISLTSTLTLKKLYFNNTINKKCLDSCQKDLSQMLHSYLYDNYNNKSYHLNHVLFTLKNDLNIIKSCKDYNKTLSILNNVITNL